MLSPQATNRRVSRLAGHGAFAYERTSLRRVTSRSDAARCRHKPSYRFVHTSFILKSPVCFLVSPRQTCSRRMSGACRYLVRSRPVGSVRALLLGFASPARAFVSDVGCGLSIACIAHHAYTPIADVAAYVCRVRMRGFSFQNPQRGLASLYVLIASRTVYLTVA